MTEERRIEMDRMRFTKNTASSNLVLLAIVFDVFYFVSIYKSDVGSWYYTILIGASILYNLVFLLAAFLCSEGVKNYKLSYSWLLILLGAVQAGRIFFLPMRAHEATVLIRDTAVTVMPTGQFIRVVVYLAASAVCCIAAALIGIRKGVTLNAYTALLEPVEQGSRTGEAHT